MRDTSRCESSVAPVSDNLIAWENWKLCLRIPRKPTARRSGAAQAAERHDGCVREEGGQKVGCNWNRNAGDENNKRQKKICCTMMERMDKRDQELRKDEEEPELVE